MANMKPKMITDVKVRTGKVRASYAHFFEPYSMEEDQKKKYQVSAIIPKSDKETVRMIESAIKQAFDEGKERYGKDFKGPKLSNPLRDGGAVGALKAMGGEAMGLTEEEMKTIVESWRGANSKIVQFWWDVDSAVIKAVREHKVTKARMFTFHYESGFLIATLPSGRSLFYAKPHLMENQFGRPELTYMGTGTNRKWQRIESYGPKIVENLIQGFCRDLLAEAIERMTKAGYRIVMHIHDEVVIEAPMDADLKTACDLMSVTPDWAPGLKLSAAGFAAEFYQKD